MKIRLLPSHVSDPANLQPLTSFIVNEAVAIDAGSIGFALGLEAQRMVRQVILTHSHTDHIASLPVLVAETFPFLKEPVHVYGTAEVISALKQHVFNDKIWPDFHQIPLPGSAGSSLCYHEITPPVPFHVDGLKVTPVCTNHTVPTVGLIVEDSSAAVVFTSDTYHTDEIWQVANALAMLRAVFVDVSYPNEMEALAAESRHLTPNGLEVELKKLRGRVPVYAVHLKPQFRCAIIEQLSRLGSNVSVGEIGRDYIFEE